VRIALSGAHAVGKTSLVAELRQQLNGYEAVDEAYCELLDEGHGFADPPSVYDFLAQLDHSIARLRSDHGAHRLYDRCPADFLAYLAAAKAHDAARERLGAASEALRTLDLIVFVPIERPDRIASTHGADRLRARVDALLREILIDDSYGFGRPVVEVHGSVAVRAKQVTSAIQEHDPATRLRAV
jgi:predicted ATPase